jgi:hypothetical protein
MKLLNVQHLLRLAWAAPASMLGMGLAGLALCAGARAHHHRGVLEVSGGRLDGLLDGRHPLLHFDAITLGHVVLGRNPGLMAVLRAHERVHVRQYERWGVFFFPAYLGSSLWQWLRGRDPYRDNRFEREAFREAARVPGADA